MLGEQKQRGTESSKEMQVYKQVLCLDRELKRWGGWGNKVLWGKAKKVNKGVRKRIMSELIPQHQQAEETV